MVDLACMRSLVEKNLVTHHAASPSISTVTTSSYPPTQTSASPSRGPVQPFALNSLPDYGANQYGTQTRPPSWLNGSGSNDHQRQFPGYGYPPQVPYNSNYPPQNSAYVSTQPRPSINGSRAEAPGTLSRNLIGSLSGSAFKLVDEEKQTGLWFVFQDLSVRTEGWFRLKFSFFDLKDGGLQPEPATTNALSKFAPMLACVYSKPFKVYSAKKFPGVIESTALSKIFAEQGIKIPIRKDGGKDGRSGEKRKRRGGSSEEDEESGGGEE